MGQTVFEHEDRPQRRFHMTQIPDLCSIYTYLLWLSADFKRKTRAPHVSHMQRESTNKQSRRKPNEACK